VILRRVAGWLRAVDDVSLAIQPGETFGLVGESGCGKTTLARLMLLLQPPTHGSIVFKGTPVNGLSPRELRPFRRAVQAVFQDPYSSLNPRLRVESIVAEPLVVNTAVARAQVRERVEELLTLVGLRPDHARLYPHQFSGGQRQRVAIARALSVDPSLIVLDEPVSALDVSIRAQILNLLKDLQARRGLSYLLIAHDLAPVRYMSHRLGVMYLGQMVETGPARKVFARPLHPYTQMLYAAAATDGNGQQTVAQGEPRAPTRTVAQGEPHTPAQGELPSPIDPPSGCRFRTRCAYVMDECSRVEPSLKEVEPDHWVACHLY
jgi:oligopeptide/dipeptide ABC transporter ATP-binding protein